MLVVCMNTKAGQLQEQHCMSDAIIKYRVENKLDNSDDYGGSSRSPLQTKEMWPWV